MNPTLVLTIIGIYFAILFLISYLTTRKIDSQSFYLGNRRSPWYIIAVAMIGTSISGVTFVSVPGYVLTDQFSYMQMVLGFVLGYFVVAKVLLPLYYKLNLTSIYGYLKGRFGFFSYKTGAAFFLISRTLGSAFRLYIVAIVLQKALFDAWNIPFTVTVSVTILLIFLYTRKGGIKTVIWTDTVQTLVLIGTVVLCIYQIAGSMNFSFGSMVKAISGSDLSRIWFFDNWQDGRFFFKQFIAGVFTTITMTGLDQDMMQKNLSCRNLKDAQKNMYSYSLAFLPINLIFLSLGVLLMMFAQKNGILIPSHTDDLFPTITTGINPATGELYLGTLVGVLFILGIISAAYSSADSALTALTTSFTVDILGIKNDDKNLLRKRTLVHIGIAIMLGVVIVLFRIINNESVIKSIYTVAGYTYGPLLGLFAFGMFTKWQVYDRLVPVVAVLSPILCYIISSNSEKWLGGYKFSFEILILNGLITFIGLLLLSQKKTTSHAVKS
ncbi:MAG: sodium:solute symporter [Prevotellaceae bacterium]|jgi:Na+/proline symporter|nr:sodium:solute symporter [Prevotellaceae bacterium]